MHFPPQGKVQTLKEIHMGRMPTGACKMIEQEKFSLGQKWNTRAEWPVAFWISPLT